MATAWRVVASQESDNLAANSGGSAYGLPLDGYSELMNNSGLGGLPGGTELYIYANGRTIRARKVDNGAGSSFNPVMGLYPRVSEALFGTRNGGSFTVIIWRVDGGSLHPSGGTPVPVPNGAPVSGPTTGGVAGLGGTGTTPNSKANGFAIGSTDNPDEDIWTGVNRLAQEVQWYLFSDGETLYYVDGADLIAQDPGKNALIDRVKDSARIAAFEETFDNTAYQHQSNHKRKGGVQHKTRLAKIQSPTQIRLDLICGIDEFRAGDLIVLSGYGPTNGRWLISDVTRSVFDVKSALTLVPPVAPLTEVEAAGTSGTAGAANAPPPGASGAAHRGTGPYGALVDSNLAFAGVDQGIDFTGGPGHVYALADGVITRLVSSGSGWPGSPGSLLVYKMTSGSHRGRYVYTAEDFDPDPSFRVGTVIRRGQSIGIANGRGAAPGIETGWADPDGRASAHAPSSGPTAFGHDFDQYVRNGGG